MINHDLRNTILKNTTVIVGFHVIHDSIYIGM